jgi:hypothetical protein
MRQIAGPNFKLAMLPSRPQLLTASAPLRGPLLTLPLPRPSVQPHLAVPPLWAWAVSPVHLPVTMRSATNRTAKHSGSPSASPQLAFHSNRTHNTHILTMAPRSHSAQSRTPIVTTRTKCLTTLTGMPSKCVRTLLKMHPHRPIRRIPMIPRPRPSTPRDCGAQILLLSPSFIHHQLPHSLAPCGACMSKVATAQGGTANSQAVHQVLVHWNSHHQCRFQRGRTQPMRSHVRLLSAPSIALMPFSVVLPLPP